MAQLLRSTRWRVEAALPDAKHWRRVVLRRMLDGGTGQGILWSRDNPSAHEVDLEELGISTDDYCPLPPASGDFHCPIEHVHGTLASSFQAWLLHHRTLPSVEQMKEKIKELFFEVITPASVTADVARLPRLWRAVKEAGGGYVGRGLR